MGAAELVATPFSELLSLVFAHPKVIVRVQKSKTIHRSSRHRDFVIG
jgi:hypothetical protein